MSHSYRIIPDAKFEFGIFSIFGDMTHKLVSSQKGGQVIEYVYIPSGNGFKLLKNEFFYVQGRSFQPKIDPLSISAISKQKKFLHFQNVSDITGKSSRNALVVQFCKNFLRICLKDKNKKQRTFKHDRSIGFRITAVKLMLWAGEPQPDWVKGQKIFTKDLFRGTLFFCQTLNFFNLVSIVF